MAGSSDNKNVGENFLGFVDSIFGPILQLKTDVETTPSALAPTADMTTRGRSGIEKAQLAVDRAGEGATQDLLQNRVQDYAKYIISQTSRDEDFKAWELANYIPTRRSRPLDEVDLKNTQNISPLALHRAKVEEAKRAAVEAEARAEAEAEARARAEAPAPASAPASAPARAPNQRRVRFADVAAQAEPDADAVAVAAAEADAEPDADADADAVADAKSEAYNSVYVERNRKFKDLKTFFDSCDTIHDQDERVNELYSRFKRPIRQTSSDPKTAITNIISNVNSFLAELNSEEPEIRIKFYLKLIRNEDEYIFNNSFKESFKEIDRENLRLSGIRVEDYKDHAISLFEDYKAKNEIDQKKAALRKMALSSPAAAEQARAPAEAGVQGMRAEARATAEARDAGEAAARAAAAAPTSTSSLINFSNLFVGLRKKYNPDYLTPEEKELELKANMEPLCCDPHFAKKPETNNSSKVINLALEEDREKKQKELQKHRDDRDELIKLLESFFDEKNQFKQEFIVDGKFKVRDEEKYKKQKNYVNELIEDEIELALNEETSSTPLREQLSGNLKSKYLKTYQSNGKFLLSEISEEDIAKIVENAQEFFYDDRLRMLLQKDLHLLKIEKVIDEFKQKYPNNSHLGFQERESYIEGESKFQSGINYLLDRFEDFKKEKSCSSKDADFVIGQLTQISDSYKSLGNCGVNEDYENIRKKNFRLNELILEKSQKFTPSSLLEISKSQKFTPSSLLEISIRSLEDDIMEIYKKNKENKGELYDKQPALDIIKRREAELKKKEEKKRNIDKKIEDLQPKKIKAKPKAEAEAEAKAEAKAKKVKPKTLTLKEKFSEWGIVWGIGKVKQIFSYLFNRTKSIINKHKQPIEELKTPKQQQIDKLRKQEQELKSEIQEYGSWIQEGRGVEKWLQKGGMEKWLEKGGGENVSHQCIALTTFNKKPPSEEPGLLSSHDTRSVTVTSARQLFPLGRLVPPPPRSR